MIFGKYRIYVSLVLFIALSFSLFGVNIDKDGLFLTVHEVSGRFSLYILDESKNKTPLFLDQDPRTTILTILMGNRTYRMGDSFEFRQTVEETTNGITISWRSGSLEVKQRFNIDSRALNIQISVENTSESDQTIGLRYLIDTILGEKADHFTVDGTAVKNESLFEREGPSEIVSQAQNGTALHIYLQGTGLVSPDSVIFANWKRLNDASWTYEVNPKRNFSLMPYSINDSAIALYYAPETVPSGTIRSVAFRMSADKPTPTSFGVAGGLATIKEKSTGAIVQVIEDLETLNTLLSDVQELLDSTNNPSGESLAAIQQQIEELQQRKKQYEAE